MPAKKKSTAKRHTAVPATAPKKKSAATQPEAVKVSAEVRLSDAAVIAVAPMKPSETPVAVPAAVVTPVAESEKVVSAASDSIEAVSADTLAAPIAAATEMSAAAADEIIMPNTHTSELVKALRDPSADVASEAAAALGATGDKSAVDALVEVLSSKDGYFHCVVRAAAAASLGQLGDKRATSALIDGIGDEMAEASAESIRALAAIGDKSAVQPIIDVVRNNDNFYLSFVRRAAVLALVKLGGPEATEMLKTVAENYDEDPLIRQAAIDAVA